MQSSLCRFLLISLSPSPCSTTCTFLISIHCSCCSVKSWYDVHRDIKPENIFLTTSMKFKLGDFGLAIKADEELPFTRSGTLDYMAPEVPCLLTFEKCSLMLHKEQENVWKLARLCHQG